MRQRFQPAVPAITNIVVEPVPLSRCEPVNAARTSLVLAARFLAALAEHEVVERVPRPIVFM